VLSKSATPTPVASRSLPSSPRSATLPDSSPAPYNTPKHATKPNSSNGKTVGHRRAASQSSPVFPHLLEAPDVSNVAVSNSSPDIAAFSTTPSHATPSHATPSHATPSHATPSHATPSHATPFPSRDSVRSVPKAGSDGTRSPVHSATPEARNYRANTQSIQHAITIQHQLHSLGKTNQGAAYLPGPHQSILTSGTNTVLPIDLPIAAQIEYTLDRLQVCPVAAHCHKEEETCTKHMYNNTAMLSECHGWIPSQTCRGLIVARTSNSITATITSTRESDWIADTTVR
jgi:hypothetical protein